MSKVVKVDRVGFELENGAKFEHPEPFDFDPCLEEFQVVYDNIKADMIKVLTGE